MNTIEAKYDMPVVAFINTCKNNCHYKLSKVKSFGSRKYDPSTNWKCCFV